MPAHLAFPLTVGAKGLRTVVQDSAADIVQSVALLLDTRPTDRRSVPDYGLPDPTFSGLGVSTLAALIDEWEPRAEPAILEQVLAGVLEVINVAPLGAAASATFAPPARAGIAFDADTIPFIGPKGSLGVGTDLDGVPYITSSDTTVFGTEADGVPYYS
ncbi:GPW/gp25 family protein [Nocardioides baekrokdamisoli]|uniref:GPW/gp25 family protein n=1 Tax=Nocardioides baekrokdamisoli TaxID=1804624 RepID=UPI000F79D91E|nr:GPW/gp25 family protein [Nocardioides baekrokdamisoli]